MATAKESDPVIPQNAKEEFERWKVAVQQQIERCDKEITERNTEISEYDTLRNRLIELPKKLSHQILVPFGKVGFMRGELVHTNKVTVLLGANYFVDRSCFQACEIIDRRVAHLQKTISRFESEKKQALSSIELCDTMFGPSRDVIEIREEYNEEKEREWRRNRARKVASGREAASQNEKIVVLADLPNSTAETDSVSNDESKNETSDLQEVSSAKEDGRSRGSSVVAEMPEIASKKTKRPKGQRSSVRFSDSLTHSSLDEPASSVNVEPRSSTESLPRSILRNVTERSPVNEEAIAMSESQDLRPILSSSKKAFTGFVVERSAANVEMGEQGENTVDTVGMVLGKEEEPSRRAADRAQQPSTTRVSRFKLSRSGLPSE